MHWTETETDTVSAKHCEYLSCWSKWFHFSHLLRWDWLTRNRSTNGTELWSEKQWWLSKRRDSPLHHIIQESGIGFIYHSYWSVWYINYVLCIFVCRCDWLWPTRANNSLMMWFKAERCISTEIRHSTLFQMTNNNIFNKAYLSAYLSISSYNNHNNNLSNIKREYSACFRRFYTFLAFLILFADIIPYLSSLLTRNKHTMISSLELF